MAINRVSFRAPQPASAARRGVTEMLPVVVAYIPFALVVGSAVAPHGVAAASTASVVILGGSAHLAALRALDSGGAIAAVLTGVLVNARLLVYSASLARRWEHQPRWFRVAAAGLIVDPTWVAGEADAERATDAAAQRRYFFAAAGTLVTGWSLAITAGALLGARLGWLDVRIVVPLCLLGLVGSGLRVSRTRTVMVTAAAVALLTAHWPSGTGLLAAVAAGCVAGAVVREGVTP